MAWTGTLRSLTLLLPLLLPPWTPTRAMAREVVVLAPTEVHGSLGSTVTLPCHLQPLDSETPRMTYIRWTRQEPLGDPSIVAEFHWHRGPSIAEPDRVDFVATRMDADLLDASLTMSDLSPGDEANYTCEIHISTSQMESVRTWLRVFYAPQVSIALYDDIGQQGRRETSLTCDARSNPEPESYDWSTTTGSLPPSAVPQGSRLLIQPTEESINTTFICRVSNALGTGQTAMRVQLPANEMTEMPEMTLWAPTEVHGRRSDIVKLPCELQFRGSGSPEVTQVTWTRRAPSGESSVLAALHPLSGPSISEPGHVEFASAWWGPNLLDASLLVRGLQPEDEANYTCEVTMAHGGTRSAATWLRVFYAPQVSISLYDDIGQQGHRETSLT
ncbi:nectin-2-like [Sorex araneus]|uniref:nectin-2-like n=1 Tax=Sorex araneus TaxID=42254 RepID=UPI00243356B9|nr:nectin-2-like [Sorex araneus]